jgi:hypothetical protein
MHELKGVFTETELLALLEINICITDIIMANTSYIEVYFLAKVKDLGERVCRINGIEFDELLSKVKNLTVAQALFLFLDINDFLKNCRITLFFILLKGKSLMIQDLRPQVFGHLIITNEIKLLVVLNSMNLI